jgi:hypothetical protein
MFSIYDMYLLGSCAFTLVCWFIIVWFDKDNKKEIRNENETDI